MSFLNNTNPFASPIDRATDPLSPEEGNLELFFEICDIINLKEENSRDAVKVIRKKMTAYAGKNWAVVMKLLTLTETCSNNCSRKFQVQLANKDFLNELKAIIGPKLNPPIIIQEKVLYLIQHWVNIFKNDPEFKPIESVYNELRTKGVDFPLYDPQQPSNLNQNFGKSLSPDSSVDLEKRKQTNINPPALTPGVIDSQRISNQNRTIISPQSQFTRLPQSQISASAIKLNEEQIAKLNSELDIVESNIQVLNEILSDLASTKVNNYKESDVNLVRELEKTCREMQKRITQLIGSISNELLINELLRVNDELNNVFLRYERFERNLERPNFTQEQKTSASGNSAKIDRNLLNEKPLIDFGEESSGSNSSSTDQKVLNSLKNMNLATSKKSSIDEENELNSFLQNENEIKEMENWFASQEGKAYSLEHNLNQNESDQQNANPKGRTVKTEAKSLFDL